MLSVVVWKQISIKICTNYKHKRYLPFYKIQLMIIKLHRDKELDDKIEEFEKLGGCIEFKLFDIENTGTAYQRHFETAKNTLLEIEKLREVYFQKIALELNTNRDTYFKQTIHFDKLENSGTEVSLRDFLGPHYDLTSNKPIIRGKERLYNSYFYYDTEEIEKKAVDFNKILEQFEFIETDGASGAFCGAFLEPPYSTRIGKAIYGHGKFFLDFCDLLFSDLSKIEIYKWSVDCSNYFDAGKEWWGSHFWTVYNPVKNIYIGATASTTD